MHLFRLANVPQVGTPVLSAPRGDLIIVLQRKVGHIGVKGTF